KRFTPVLLLTTDLRRSFHANKTASVHLLKAADLRGKDSFQENLLSFRARPTSNPDWGPVSETCSCGRIENKPIVPRVTPTDVLPPLRLRSPLSNLRLAPAPHGYHRNPYLSLISKESICCPGLSTRLSAPRTHWLVASKSSSPDRKDIAVFLRRNRTKCLFRQ